MDQESLRICAGSSDPSLLAYTIYRDVDESSDQQLDSTNRWTCQPVRLSKACAHMR